MDFMYLVGKACQIFRKESLGLTQRDVAGIINYTKENLSAFENGRNDSAYILSWYVMKGMDLNKYIDIARGRFE